MSQSINPVLAEAMSAAIAQYTKTMGEDFPTIPRLIELADTDFWASAEMDGEELVVSVTSGLVSTVTSFCKCTFETQEINAFIPGTSDDLIHTSLVWLLLHELHHYEMGHFEFTAKLCLTEAKEPNSFNVATRSSVTTPPALTHLNQVDLLKVEPCLEMQADHDAIEMLLDAYSPDGWDIIRARTAAVSAMMVLIEREDTKRGHDLSSHPKAATRIFQLFGHVIEMPMIQAMLAQQHPELEIDPVVPSDEEQSAFNRAVVIPAFLDAMKLAVIANAETIRSDLGDPQDFFRDVQIAKLADSEKFGALATAGAIQWADLMTLN